MRRGSLRAARVNIASFKFVPVNVTIKAGGKVTWINQDVAPHTATDERKTFDTGTLKTGQRKTVTISRPGTYDYHCVFHRFMVGKVVVK